MERFAWCAIRNLMTATRPVGNDQRVRGRPTHRRQKIQFSHRARGNRMFFFISKRTGHAATRTRDRLDLKVRDQAQRFQDRFKGAERLLMAMTVHEGSGLRE
jgi:hypothetical protein